MGVSLISALDRPTPRRPALRRDGLSPRALVAVVAGVGGAHLLALWAVLQIPAVAEVAREVAPVFVNFIAPPATPTPATPPATPPAKASLVPPPPAPLATPPVAPLVAAAPSPVPAPAAVEVPAAPPVAQAAESLAAPTAPAVAPAAPSPKRIAAEAVQYLVKPPLAYPEKSKSLSEAGTTVVTVHIDEQGLPREVKVTKSSGYPRLDEAALVAVKKARFKPYAEAGRPLPVVVPLSLVFDLEN